MAKPDLFHKRKYRRLGYHLARELALGAYGEILALGFLETLWQEAYARCDDYLGDAVDVELAAGWQGEPGRLVEMLADCGGSDPGFIEEIPEQPGEFRIHNFWEHAPAFVKKRQARKAKDKEKRQADAKATPKKKAKPKATTAKPKTTAAKPKTRTAKPKTRTAKPADADRQTTASVPGVEAATTDAERRTNGRRPALDNAPPAVELASSESVPAEERRTVESERRTKESGRRTNGADRPPTSAESRPSASVSASASASGTVAESPRTPPPTPAPRPAPASDRPPAGRPTTDGDRPPEDGGGTRPPGPPPDAGRPPVPGGGPPGGGGSRKADSPMTHSERLGAVFDAHDLGLRTLAEIEGRKFRPHSREQKKRRRIVGEALRTVGFEVARQAARNLPLSKHHRGENDRGTRYLDVEYALRRPEAIAELFEGSDEAFPGALRRSLGLVPEHQNGGDLEEIEEFEGTRIYVESEVRMALYERLLAEHDHRIDVDEAPIPENAHRRIRDASTEAELKAALQAGLREVESMDLAPLVGG